MANETFNKQFTILILQPEISEALKLPSSIQSISLKINYSFQSALEFEACDDIDIEISDLCFTDSNGSINEIENSVAQNTEEQIYSTLLGASIKDIKNNEIVNYANFITPQNPSLNTQETKLLAIENLAKIAAVKALYDVDDNKCSSAEYDKIIGSEEGWEDADYLHKENYEQMTWERICIELKKTFGIYLSFAKEVQASQTALKCSNTDLMSFLEQQQTSKITPNLG